MKLKVFLTSILLSLIFPSSALAATLSLSPSTGTFNKGCQFSLDLSLDTEGISTDGTDAILNYDSSRLSTNTSSITPVTTTYPDFPGNNVDEAGGKITISGLASVSQPFTGKATLAKINFTVKDTAPTGITQIKFDFDPNDKAKTTDSNVVQRGTVADVLSAVINGNYTIGTGTICAAQGATGLGQGQVSTPSATEQPVVTQIPVKTLPPAGSETLTFTIAIVGSVLTVLGILGLAIL